MANGVQENRIAKAKELIAQKDYNDAILILTQVVRQEPDRQDEAQELISEIVRQRNLYNDDYENLIKLLYDQKDEATALKVIAQLENLDKNPNKQTQEDIRQAKRTARLVANNKRYQDIMNRALAFLDRKDYAGAVQVYLEGQDLAKDMFVEANYGNVVADLVDRSWADLRGVSSQFVQAEAKLQDLPTRGATLVTSESTSTALDQALNSMKDLAVWRQKAWNDSHLFQTQNELIGKSGQQQDFFLSYSYLIVHGRPDAKRPEGILGAVDRFWDDVMQPWTDQIRSGVDARYNQAKVAFDQGRFADAGEAFRGLRVRARHGLDAVTLWNRLMSVDEAGTIDPQVRARMATIVPLGVWLDHRLTLAIQGEAASVSLPKTLTVLGQTTADRPTLEATRADLRTEVLSFTAFGQRVGQWGTQTRSLETAGYTTMDQAPFSAEWEATWRDLRGKALQQEAEIVDRRGSLDYGLLDGRFQAIETTLNTARDQTEGAVKYSLQAAQKLEPLRPLQDALARDVVRFIALYDGEPAEVKTPPVVRWVARGQDLLARITASQAAQTQLLALAESNYQQSQNLKKQGQDQLPQIAASVSAENFAQARTLLNKVSTSYSQSLALQEDAAFRSESDAQIKALSDQILKAENEVVVRDVRKLITDGSQAYLAQLFTQAEQLLTRARARWATTNTEPNAEVEYWATLASYALSVTTGRELSPIDPLYNEVQQLLNFARQNYNEGKAALDAGQKESGLASMKQARDILTKILVPFPLNQEARLLNLEILKASDPDNFPKLFQETFDAAVTRMSTDATGAYNDLLDLDKIQPNFPGMAPAIKQVRIKLNLDRPPIDPKAVAQSKALVAEATRLVAGGTLTQVTAAQGQVRQALQLDPTNAEAQSLSDRISLILKPTVVTFTPTMVGEFNAILDLVRTQKTLDALSQLTAFKDKYPGVGGNEQVVKLSNQLKSLNRVEGQ